MSARRPPARRGTVRRGTVAAALLFAGAVFAAPSIGQELHLFEERPAVLGGAPGPVAVRAELPGGAAVGETVTAAVTLTMDEGNHVYAVRDAGEFTVPTAFEFAPSGLEPAGEWQPDAAAEEATTAGVTVRQHHGTVTWTRDYTVSAAAYGLSGEVTYQVCTDKSCLPPKSVPATLGTVGAAPAGAAAPAEVALTDEFEVDAGGRFANLGLSAVLPAAFAAGFILNFMPCVLPVIPIKMMSFVQQAGESRRTVLKLNLWFAAGVLAVFMAFAALSVGLGELIGAGGDYRWGQQLDGPDSRSG